MCLGCLYTICVCGLGGEYVKVCAVGSVYVYHVCLDFMESV